MGGKKKVSELSKEHRLLYESNLFISDSHTYKTKVWLPNYFSEDMFVGRRRLLHGYNWKWSCQSFWVVASLTAGFAAPLCLMVAKAITSQEFTAHCFEWKTRIANRPRAMCWVPTITVLFISFGTSKYSSVICVEKNNPLWWEATVTTNNNDINCHNEEEQMEHDCKCVCWTEGTEVAYWEGLFPNSQGPQPVICCLLSKMITTMY